MANVALPCHYKCVIGFEAELSVPTFQVLNGIQDRNDAILSFLFGGFRKTDEPVGGNEFFKIKPDVSDYQRVGRKILVPLSGFVKVERKQGDVWITKMEYETPPVDEAADDANKKFVDQATAIIEHSDSFFSQAKSGIVEVPSPAAYGMYAGVPVGQIQELVQSGRAHDNQRARMVAEDLYNAMREMLEEVKPEFAIHATAGILPSAIQTLFESGEKPLDRPSSQLANAWSVGYPLLVDFVRATMAKNVWAQNLAEGVGAAFKGHLYLIASYLLGEALTQTTLFKGMSAKNAVPYHAKLNLGDYYLAAPRLPEVPNLVAENIFNELNSREWTKSAFWVEKLKSVAGLNIEIWENAEHLVYGGPRDFVLNALGRRKVRTFINQRGGYLSGEKPREHAQPDPAPANAEGASGIQLEFRRLGAAVGPTDLQRTFLNVVREVRTINLPYLAPEAQQRMRGLMDAY